MSISHIEWTDATWNPTTGCDRISPGCDNCYALTMAKRLKGMGQAKYQTDGDPRTSGPGFGLAVHQDALRLPLAWRKPKRIFVNSMSDLFHDAVPAKFIAEVFAVMAATDHSYQILTKRHGRMRTLLKSDDFKVEVNRQYVCLPSDVPTLRGYQWPLPNVWLGVSAEDQYWADVRIHALLGTPAAVRFVSAEPLVGPIDLRNLDAGRGRYIDSLHGDVKTASGEIYAACPGALDWVIVGGESGARARSMDEGWARSLVGQCRDAGTRVFVKQLGSGWARDTFVGGIAVAKNDPKGGDPDWWPTDLRVREYPAAA